MGMLSFIITVIINENYHTKNIAIIENSKKDKIGTCKQTKRRPSIFERSVKHLI